MKKAKQMFNAIVDLLIGKTGISLLIGKEGISIDALLEHEEFKKYALSAGTIRKWRYVGRPRPEYFIPFRWAIEDQLDKAYTLEEREQIKDQMIKIVSQYMDLKKLESIFCNKDAIDVISGLLTYSYEEFGNVPLSRHKLLNWVMNQINVGWILPDGIYVVYRFSRVGEEVVDRVFFSPSYVAKFQQIVRSFSDEAWLDEGVSSITAT